MNKWQSLLIIVAVALLVVPGLGGLGLVSSTSAAASGYTLSWSVVGGGGNASTRLSSTAGQTAIGWSTGARQLGSGFWYGIGTGGITYDHFLYLPLTLKNY